MTTLFIELDHNSPLPLQQQLTDILRQKILTGEIKGEEKLPSSRALALTLGVSRIVTLYAYEQLIAESYLTAKAGAGTFVQKGISASPKVTKNTPGPDWFPQSLPHPSPAQNISHDFTMGRPATSLIDEKAWKRSWRWALSRPLTDENAPPEGIPELREAIAELVQRSRGIICTAGDVVITTGAVETLTLMARVSQDIRPTIYLENPGFSAAWNVFESYGHKIQPVDIDQQGLSVRGLPHQKDHPALLFCTPSHQFPLGFRMSARRRLELLAWATEQKALILEDDYDSEFRYDGAPLPTLKSQDTHGHVVYFSSLSKSLTPSVRLGYLIAPEKVRHSIAREIADNHRQPPLLLQQAMAHFIKNGALDKHMRRTRRHYAALNKIVREELSNLPSYVNLHGLEGGLHCFLSLPEKHDMSAVKKRLDQKNIRIDSLDQRRHAPTHWNGLVLGYGHMKTDDLREGLKTIVQNL